ncbi:MAG: SDR family NAD(P)-dependent oxidoreductase [Kiloniellales bacterium]
MTDNPHNRVVLVSGASRGIGAAVAKHLAGSGWLVSLGMRKPEALEGIDEARCQLVRHDALQADEADWVGRAMERFGRIDGLVCCAGIMIPETVISIEEEALERMWQVNVASPRRLIKAAWEPLCAAGNGRVVVLASLSGKRAKTAGSGAYAMTKHAALAMTQGVRLAGWDEGVRATAICPGFVATDMARAITDYPENEMSQPEDMAAMVAFALNAPAFSSPSEITVNCQKEGLF